MTVGAMNILSRMTRAPLALNPALAADVPMPQAARVLTDGMAGSSSYLRSLLLQEGAWFADVIDTPPETVFAGVLAGLPGAGDLGQALRVAKRRVALLLAACDLGGVWTLEDVTGRLSDFADVAVGLALDAEVEKLAARGKLAHGQGAAEVGLIALAMGKMGARELNYSSDIDLIMLFDDADMDPESYQVFRAQAQKITRNAMQTLSAQTGEGYVFRTDLRLRPNPSATPACVPMEAAERYYESEGRTWERAAFIKARACAGDLVKGQAFLDGLRPFIWRRHLDFNAVRDAHDMRLAIREHKGLGGPIEVPGHDMKLGRGGIREIEFFAQTRQLISGGRDPDLRVSGTVEALGELARKGWTEPEVARTLTEAYRAHRETEHRIQMLRDAQTHQMPLGGEALDQVARLSGWGDTQAFVADQAGRLEEVNALIERFFAPQSASGGEPQVPAELAAAMDDWIGLPALRTERAKEIFRRLRPDLAERILGKSDPDATLRQLDRFIRGLPAGVQLFALFEANPSILDLLLDICATAPGLAAYLSHNSGVFDAVISGRFFDPIPDADGFLAALEAALRGAADFEEILLRARRWQKEQHFRIGVLLLRNLADLGEVEAGYSQLAEAVLRGLLPRVEAEVMRRYGRFEAQSVAVLAMGKLGSAQMTASSDLDLIVIYRAEGDCADGRQGLAPAQYFARLTQTLITALESAMAEGQLYEVDMRLRPSGRQGPVAVSIAGFEEYQKTQAWTWEHLALTRARALAGDGALCARLEQARRDILAMPRDRDKTLTDVRDMRARIAGAKAAGAGRWEVKDRTGGLMDAELAAQTLAVLSGGTARDPRGQIADAVAAGALAPDRGQALVEAHRFLSAVQQAQRLLVDGRFDPDALGRDGFSFICAFAEAAGAQGLLERIDAACADIAAGVERILNGG